MYTTPLHAVISSLSVNHQHYLVTLNSSSPFTHPTSTQVVLWTDFVWLEQAQYVGMPITEERPRFTLNLKINDLINARYSTHL